MTAHVNGVDLFYEVMGTGRPLLMVHGNGEDHTIFAEAAAVLKDEFTCYLVDSRGHGGSTPVGELHYKDMAKDMIALVEHLDLRNVVFYGFSDGGIVGLMAAARCERITALIVSGANLTPFGLKWYWRPVFRAMYLVNRDPKLRLMLREPHIGNADLKMIRMPTLVLAGSRDMIRTAHTRKIASGIPGAQLKILDGEGHGTYVIHEVKIGRIIRAFVRETGGAEEKHAESGR